MVKYNQFAGNKDVKWHNYAIDFVRIIAATMIVLHHYQQGCDIEFAHITFYNGMFEFGYIVELFFIISGLFSYEYTQKIADSQSLWRFYKLKIFRIIPLLAISVLAESFIYFVMQRLILGTDLSFTWIQMLANCIGIQSLGLFPFYPINGPSWYISVLLFCYMIFGVLTLGADRLRINPFCLYVVMIGIGWGIRQNAIDYAFFNTTMARGYISFFAGILVAYYLKRYDFKKLYYFMMPGFIVLFWWLFFVCNIREYYLYIFFLWIPLVVFCVSPKMSKVSANRVIGFLGKVSFGVYIWNEPLTAFRNMILLIYPEFMDLSKISSMLFCVILNWTWASLSYFYIENPIRKRLYKT